MHVLDYVLYNGKPIVEFRLKYLNNFVDRFIIVVSIYTHSEIKKMISILILINIFLKIIERKYIFILFTIYKLKLIQQTFVKIIDYMKIKTRGLTRYINEIIFKNVYKTIH